MERIEDLEKAIAETAQAGEDLLKKSQMSLFGDPHHVGYTRVNASGTSSTIAAKGNPTKQQQKISDHNEQAAIFGLLRTEESKDPAALIRAAELNEIAAKTHTNPSNAELHASRAKRYRSKAAEIQAKRSPTIDHGSDTNGFKEGEDVKAHDTYGGKQGRVVSSTDSGYVTVDHGDGTQAIYHNSDLDHHDGWDEDEDD